MRRIAVLAVILTVVLPAVFAYAASLNITYGGSSVFVIPIEDVVTEQVRGPAPQTVASSPSVMLYAGDGATDAPSCPGGAGCDDRVEPEAEPEQVESLIPVVEEPTPGPTPTPRSPQTPRLAGGGAAR